MDDSHASEQVLLAGSRSGDLATPTEPVQADVGVSFRFQGGSDGFELGESCPYARADDKASRYQS